MAATYTSLRQAWLALSGLSVVFLVEMLDNSLLTLALPAIARDTGAAPAALQWVQGSYSLVLGGLMILLGVLADRAGRRRTMLLGLLLLALASLATLGVHTVAALIAVRCLMGLAAAMTAPGAMSLAFRLFTEDEQRVRAINLISTVGLVGLAAGPVVGGAVLAVLPWRSLLVVNAPLALLAWVGIRCGVAPDDPAEAHREPLDILGAVLGTGALVLLLLAPSLLVHDGVGSPLVWIAAVGGVAAMAGFVARQRRTEHPLIPLSLLATPLVGAGLLFKAATGLATAGLGYLVTLQLQLVWGFPPVLAAVAMAPQVLVLLAGGALLTPLVRRVGMSTAAVIGAVAVVAGLAVEASLGFSGYPALAVALALVAVGQRIVGVVAGTNVMKGLPESRTTLGAALVDTASEVSTGVGVAVAGTLVAAFVSGSFGAVVSGAQRAQLVSGVTVAAVVLTVASAVLVGWGFLRASSSVR